MIPTWYRAYVPQFCLVLRARIRHILVNFRDENLPVHYHELHSTTILPNPAEKFTFDIPNHSLGVIHNFRRESLPKLFIIDLRPSPNSSPSFLAFEPCPRVVDRYFPRDFSRTCLYFSRFIRTPAKCGVCGFCEKNYCSPSAKSGTPF